jgi:hypothetical protein
MKAPGLRCASSRVNSTVSLWGLQCVIRECESGSPNPINQSCYVLLSHDYTTWLVSVACPVVRLLLTLIRAMRGCLNFEAIIECLAPRIVCCSGVVTLTSPLRCNVDVWILSHVLRCNPKLRMSDMYGSIFILVWARCIVELTEPRAETLRGFGEHMCGSF